MFQDKLLIRNIREEVTEGIEWLYKDWGLFPGFIHFEETRFKRGLNVGYLLDNHDYYTALSIIRCDIFQSNEKKTQRISVENLLYFHFKYNGQKKGIVQLRLLTLFEV